MPVLGRCWTPFTLYSWSSVKLGSYYAAIYTAIIHVLFITYAIYVMGGGDSDEFYSPYFELDVKGTMIAGWFTIIFSALFMGTIILLVYGIKRENRCMFFPWMVGITIEILLVLAFSLWVLATYYRNPYSVLASCIIWCLDGIHVYCLLCVISQYQILQDLQIPHFDILYP